VKTLESQKKLSECTDDVKKIATKGRGGGRGGYANLFGASRHSGLQGGRGGAGTFGRKDLVRKGGS